MLVKPRTEIDTNLDAQTREHVEKDEDDFFFFFLVPWFARIAVRADRLLVQV